MKVSQMPYERPDKQQVVDMIKKAQQDFCAAQSAKQQFEIDRALDAALSSFRTMATIADVRHSLNTEDEFYKGEREFWNVVSPEIDQAVREFYGEFLQSAYLEDLKKLYPPVFFVNMELSQKASGAAAVPLLVQENQLRMLFGKASRKVQFEFNGEHHTSTTIGKYFSSEDRELRKSAYMAWGKALNEAAEDLDEVFDKMVKLRTEIANKLGFESFTEVGYLKTQRNCYGKADIAKFRAAVKKYIVPLCVELKEKVKADLGIEKNMVFDNIVFTKKEPKPLGSVEEIFEKGIKMYQEMSQETGELMRRMVESEAVDCLARTGKRSGGFCTSFDEFKLPFIYANFTGTLGDLDVLTHEFGHAFAADRAFSIPFSSLRSGSSDINETHSMSMEFLTYPWMPLFFGDKTDEYKRNHLGAAICFIPYAVIVDYFQEWCYDNFNATPKQRNEKWKELEKEFLPFVSMEWVPFFEDGRRWQRQPHVFFSPFYYIDYALARVAAFQIFALMKKDFKHAFEAYLNFLLPGGTKTFTELLDGAGLKSPFDESVYGQIAQTIREELF